MCFLLVSFFLFKFLFFSFFAQHGVRLQQHGKHRFCNGVLCHWGGVYFSFFNFICCVLFLRLVVVEMCARLHNNWCLMWNSLQGIMIDYCTRIVISPLTDQEENDATTHTVVPVDCFCLVNRSWDGVCRQKEIHLTDLADSSPPSTVSESLSSLRPSGLFPTQHCEWVSLLAQT